MAGTARIARGDLAGLDALQIDALVLPMFAVRAQPRSVAGYVDWRLCGRIARLLRSGRFVGEAGEALLMPSLSRLGAGRVFLLGLGRPSEIAGENLPKRIATVVKVLHDARATRLAVAPPVAPGAGDPKGARAAVAAPGTKIMSAWLAAIGRVRADVEELILLDDDGTLEAATVELADAARRSGLTWQS